MTCMVRSQALRLRLVDQTFSFLSLSDSESRCLLSSLSLFLSLSLYRSLLGLVCCFRSLSASIPALYRNGRFSVSLIHRDYCTLLIQ